MVPEVRGKVQDVFTAKAIADATVYLQDSANPPQLWSVGTDAGGNFKFVSTAAEADHSRDDRDQSWRRTATTSSAPVRRERRPGLRRTERRDETRWCLGECRAIGRRLGRPLRLGGPTRRRRGHARRQREGGRALLDPDRDWWRTGAARHRRHRAALPAQARGRRRRGRRRPATAPARWSDASATRARRSPATARPTGTTRANDRHARTGRARWTRRSDGTRRRPHAGDAPTRLARTAGRGPDDDRALATGRRSDDDARPSARAP